MGIIKKTLLLTIILKTLLFYSIFTCAAANLEENQFEAIQDDVILKTALSYTHQNIPYFEDQEKNWAITMGKDSEAIRFSDSRVDYLYFKKDIGGYKLYSYTPSYLPVDVTKVIEVGGIELTRDGWLSDNEPKYLVLFCQEDEISVIGVMYCELSPDLNNEAFRVTWNNWLSDAFLKNEESDTNYQSGIKCVQYIDVPPESWYSEYVDIVSKAKLMIGVGENRFVPEANITLAEVYTITARIHAFYHNGSTEAADRYETDTDKPWYNGYVKYCMDNGIMLGEPGEVTHPASRVECASLISCALPDEDLTAINKFADDAIPDLPSTQGTERVYLLYRAGVLTGMDAEGTFNPECNVTRGQIAAIVTQMINPEYRRQ